ncbi:hypothetical protein MSG28_009433 [Choristoneura fumiferana]|uniref:Uncharacterized protein n=1 Tax=Choristoneura fumiferana TaxID=7141 RepID=A0ACC0KY43_CHOFU|nr:hypothetical protein MSG28_009433 [Choristoneura fumiferana]
MRTVGRWPLCQGPLAGSLAMWLAVCVGLTGLVPVVLQTLACGANTSFSVVYLGRREGPVSAHLYIHTSLGVHKYPVSAVGVASEWGLWPLVGVRVPHNATLTPLLTLHNPTPHTVQCRDVQVQEIYSSVGWLGLQLPGGAATAPRALWAVPPHSSRALVRLRLAAPPPLPGKPRDAPDPRAAYIRIKANVTGPPLVVVVEALAAPPGAHAQPLQLRAGTRGAQDPPYKFEITMGNSEGAWQAVAGGALPPRCRAAPHAPPPPPPAPRLHNGAAAHAHTHTHNGAAESAEGAQLTFLRTQLEPHQQPEPAAEFTLDFAKLWARGISPDDEEAEQSEDDEGGAGGAERWCAGWCCAAAARCPTACACCPARCGCPHTYSE